MVTGEIKYHDALGRREDLLAVAAGHDFTESPGLDALRSATAKALGLETLILKQKSRKMVL